MERFLLPSTQMPHRELGVIEGGRLPGMRGQAGVPGRVWGLRHGNCTAWSRLTLGSPASAAGAQKRFMSGLSSVSKFLLSASLPLIAQLALISSLVTGFS